MLTHYIDTLIWNFKIKQTNGAPIFFLLWERWKISNWLVSEIKRKICKIKWKDFEPCSFGCIFSVLTTTLYYWVLISIFLLVCSSFWNHHGQTIHPLKKFISTNYFWPPWLWRLFEVKISIMSTPFGTKCSIYPTVPHLEF